MNFKQLLDKVPKEIYICILEFHPDAKMNMNPAMSDNPDECVKTVNEVLKIPREDNKIIAKVASKMFVKK